MESAVPSEIESIIVKYFEKNPHSAINWIGFVTIEIANWTMIFNNRIIPKVRHH